MSKEIHIYNSLTRQKEVFNPIVKNHVGMYVCGPTVYGDPHLGHARPGITFDVVFRYLKHSGYAVRYVRNITDAGHLENDADEGEDKIAKKARLEQLEPMEIVQFHTISYHKAMEALNCLPPSIEPRATGHIIEQIELVLFKGSRHFKRGHGVIIIPHDRFGIIYKKKKRKRVQCAKCGNHGHNARSCKNETREKPPDKPTEKKKCKVCGQLEKGHICTGFQKDENKISNILRFFKGLF